MPPVALSLTHPVTGFDCEELNHIVLIVGLKYDSIRTLGKRCGDHLELPGQILRQDSRSGRRTVSH